MQTNEEYNKHLQDFYSQTFRQYVMEHGIENSSANSAQKYADEMLNLYGLAVNQGMAYELLSKTEILATSSEDKLLKYPTMYWQTLNGKEFLKEICKKELHVNVQKIFNKDDITAIDVIIIWKHIVSFGKKIALKDNKIGSDMIGQFSHDFLEIFKKKMNDDNSNDYVSIFKSALNQVISEKNDFKISAYYDIDKHLHSLKHDIEKDPHMFKKEQIKPINNKTNI